jgi:hypothetical protein
MVVKQQVAVCDVVDEEFSTQIQTPCDRLAQVRCAICQRHLCKTHKNPWRLSFPGASASTDGVTIGAPTVVCEACCKFISDPHFRQNNEARVAIDDIFAAFATVIRGALAQEALAEKD